MGYGSLVVGITLLLLALVMGAGFLMELTSGPISPNPFGMDPDPDDGAQGDIILDMKSTGGSAERTTTQNGQGSKRPGSLLFGTGQDANELPHDGVLTQGERNAVTEDGFLPYAIQPGESVRDIANRYLGKERLWKTLREYNPTALMDPGQVAPGTVIRIPLWLREDF